MSTTTERIGKPLEPWTPAGFRPGPFFLGGSPNWPANEAGCRRVGRRAVHRVVAGTRLSPTPLRWPLGTVPKTPVLDLRERLVCSRCGGRQVDMVLTGTKR